jgi:hypothetical protein
MTRGQETRLKRLERNIPAGGADVFVAWGTDEEQASRALAEACERGEVCKGDLVICAVWPHADDLPPARWVTFRQLSDREEEAILSTLKLRIGFCEEARGPCCADPELLQMSSDELFQCLADVV